MGRLRVVGEYIEKFNTATGQNIPLGPILQSAGLYAHVKKRHPDELDNLDYVSLIISEPDYIGSHPTESANIELVKVLEKNVMVCVKLDVKEMYPYVASVFTISEGKLKNRIASGRLKKY